MCLNFLRNGAVGSSSLLILAAIGWTASLSAAEPSKKPLPAFSQIEKLVKEQFMPPPVSKPIAIMTQDDVAPFFEQLKKLGWDVADRKAIIDSLLPDSDPLVSELRTPQGRALMAEIYKLPGAYDKLDRMTRLPHGPQTVHDLTKAKDGFKMVEYLTSTKGGAELSKMLSRDSKDDFSQPTGHVYTADQFLVRLRQSYDAALVAQDASAKAGKPTTPGKR